MINMIILAERTSEYKNEKSNYSCRDIEPNIPLKYIQEGAAFLQQPLK